MVEMLKSVLLLLSVQFCVSKNILYYPSNETHQAYKKQPGFLLSLPKTLVSGRNETVCVSLHEALAPAKILIDIKFKEKHYRTINTIDSDSTCFKIKVPVKKVGDPQFVSVKVQVQINGHVYTAHNQDPILLYPSESNRVLIETDRNIYKPGDTVKFFVLQLDSDLLPVSRQVTDIHIKNPMGITVMVWEDLKLNHGLLNLNYQTPQDALLGKWTVQVENQTRIFEITKYTLPRFKIDLKFPKLIHYQADSVTVSVCGRYSYNRPVPGIAFIKVSHNFGRFEAFNKLNEMVNGCSDFKIDRTELGLDTPIEHTKSYIHVTATITEYGTNKMDMATGKSKIVYKGYNIKFVGDTMFTPGLPYKGQVKLINSVKQVEHEVLEICYTIAIKKSWNYFNNEPCNQYPVSKEGVVDFQLWPFKSNVLHVHLHAKSLNNSLIVDELLLVRLFTPSSSFVEIRKDSSQANQTCNSLHQYKVVYSTERFSEAQKVKFFYSMKSPKQILNMGVYEHTVAKRKSLELNEGDFLGPKHKFVKTDQRTDHFNLTVNLTTKFVTNIQVLVYYITLNGETVAGTIVEVVEPCTFQVTSEWTNHQILAGSTATLSLKSNGPSMCAVSATDKAVKFMSGNNNQQTLSLGKVLNAFSPEKESARSGRNSCVSVPKKGQSKNEGHETGLVINLRRRKRHVYSFSEDYDAYDVFSNFGIITITNLQVITKPCYSGPLVNESYQVQFLTDPHATNNDDNTQLGIRSYFPENWLWELVPITDSVQLQRTVPHSITNWLTTVFCVSESEGIGFTKDIELTVFQSFFVEILAPYSIRKGENFNFLLHVSNYVNYSFPIKISVKLSENLQKTHELSDSYCLAANNTQTLNYPITGTEIGAANITVLVESDSQNQLACGPTTVPSKRDLVFKSFKVEPEGYYIANSKSVLLCANKTRFDSNVSWSLQVPNDVVEGTIRGLISVNGDILGHSVENLHQLLTIPTGCGEQIMASMAPNIYILRYLNATQGLTSVTKQRIIRNLKLGYQRILNYIHPDGSFSAFGYHDPAGSMFLTTFVVRILQEAKGLIYVDQRVIDRAVKWIFEHQLENGCFDTMYHVFQDMGGTNMENSTAGLTAYVILSLFDGKVDVPDSVQTNAKYCIRGQVNPDKYSIAISSYALFKVKWISEARRFLEKAFAVVNREDGLMWWTAKGNNDSLASDIEITSYVLLALMEQKTAENMAYAHSIVQWLVSKMSSTGGFKSTQDTIVALDALTKYANHIHSDNLALNIKLDTTTESHIFAIKREDRLKSKEVSLSNLDGTVSVSLEGIGCVLTQLTLSYHTTVIAESESFKLALEIAPVSNVDQCSIKSISPCVAYEGPEQVSSMAVMELVLPSGFQADRGSLYELLERKKNNNIKRFEETEDQINIYFTSLGRNQVCFSFFIHENLAVQNRKDSVVKLYDYYKPEQSLLQFYKVVNNCSVDSIEGLQDNGGAKVEALLRLDQSENHSKCVYLGINQTDRHSAVFRRDSKSINQSDFTDEIPSCVYYPVNTTRTKRDLGNTTTTKSDLTCRAVTFPPGSKRTKKSLIWVKYKRDTSINQHFVDIDVDMEAPVCINIPFYAFTPGNNTSSSSGTALVVHSAKTGQPTHR